MFKLFFYLLIGSSPKLEAIANSGFKSIAYQSDERGPMQKTKKQKTNIRRTCTGKLYHDHVIAFTFQSPIYLERLFPS